jgi:hypothetical protein
MRIGHCVLAPAARPLSERSAVRPENARLVTHGETGFEAPASKSVIGLSRRPCSLRSALAGARDW